MTIRLILVRTALAVAVAFTIAACSDGESPLNQTGSPVPTPESDAGASSEADAEPGLEFDLTPVVEEIPFDVGRSFWHSGFAVTITDGLFYAEERLSGGVLHYVTINARFENVGPDEASFFFTPASLVVDGIAAIEAGDLTELPSVPAGLVGEGTFGFLVDADFSPDDAELRIGHAGDEIAVVPLGADASGLVTLEPRTLDTVEGSISLELVDLELTGAELRADVPAGYEGVPEGTRALTITFDATSRKSGNWSIFPDNFALVLPSGSAIGVDGSTLFSLPGDDSGITTPDHSIRFLVDADPAGTYALRFTAPDPLVGDDGETEGTVEFSIS